MRLGQAAMEALRAEITGQLYPGQELVVTKWIALSGTGMLAQRKYQELRAYFSVPFLREAQGFAGMSSVEREWSLCGKLSVSARFALGEGGIFTGLWKMAEAGEVGLEIDLRKIPIRQETVELCERYEINPYQFSSSGALLLGTSQGSKVVQALENLGIPGTIIGYATDRRERLLHNQEHIRYLDRPQKDESWKIQ